MSQERNRFATLSEQAERLRDLHVMGRPLLLANVWDCASARVLQDAGFAALGSTSRGIARTMGYPDGEAMPVDLVFDSISRIVGSTDLPVTADLETGYGLTADELVQRMLAAGAVGLNLEDSNLREGSGLVAAHEHAERVAAVRSASAAAGVDVVINARVDIFLDPSGEPEAKVAEALRRGRMYLEAGADCVYPIGALNEETISRLVGELGAPINIVHWPGTPPVARLSALGVARVSFAAGLLARCLDYLADEARRILSGEDVVSVSP
jgi:2-methylisocitrate lyase-like PEP mutase family enzyme